jgi:hypothetical protein
MGGPPEEAFCEGFKLYVNGKSLFADTALASGRKISAFVDKYGSDRLLFESDSPFGTPGSELA